MTAQQLQALRRLVAEGGSMTAEAVAQVFPVGTPQLLDALTVGGYVTLEDGRVQIEQKGCDRATS